MNRSPQHIAAILLAVWSLVWGGNVVHLWSHALGHFGHAVAEGHRCSHHSPSDEHNASDRTGPQWDRATASDDPCLLCDWDWGPLSSHPAESAVAQRPVHPAAAPAFAVKAGHRSAWLMAIHGRRGPPSKR